MKRSTALFLILGAITGVSLWAQPVSLKFRSYTTNEGLSQGTIFSIAQDAQGFIWLGTADGVNRFDGYNFKVYRDSIVSPSTRKLLPGPDQKLYISTSQYQIAEFDQLREKYRLLATNPTDRLSDSKLSFIDPENNLWYTNDSTLYKYNPLSGTLISKRFTCRAVVYSTLFNGKIYVIGYQGKILVLEPKTLELQQEIQFSIDDKFMVAACQMDGNMLWVSGMGGFLYGVNLSNGDIKKFHLPPAPAGDTRPVIVLSFALKDRSLFMGTESHGLLLFDTRQDMFLPVHPSEKTSEKLLGGRVSALFVDRTNNLWVACDPYGVCVADLKEPKFKRISTTEGPGFTLSNNFVKAVVKDSNYFYAGYYRDGFDKIDLKTGSKQRFKKNGHPDGLQDDIILCLAKDDSGNIWIGTESGLQKLCPKKNTLENFAEIGLASRVDDITILPGEDILVSLKMSILIRKGNGYKLQQLPEFKDTWVTHFDKGQSKIWLSGQTGLFSLKLEKKDSVYIYKVKKELMQYGRVKASYEENQNEVWVATVSGLIKYNPTTNSSKRYNERDGMANSFIYGLLPDKTGRLWLSTNKGLACFDPVKETFRNYTEQDGLQGNEFNTNVFALQPDGEMIFGGLGGFNYFYPEKVRDNPFAPQVNLTSIKLFDEPLQLDSGIEYKKHLELPYYNNTLSFEFTAQEYTNPEQNQYAYQLQGIDRDWVYCGKKRFIRYAGLAPGSYVLRVKATNNDGIWAQQPLEFFIHITPPFWKTTSFLAGLTIAGILLIWLFTQYYTKRQLRLRLREAELEQNARMNAIVETEDKERKRVAQELHDGLGQMLSTARLNVSGLEAAATGEKKMMITRALKIIDESCEEVRHISHNMMPGSLIQMGLVAALEDLADNLNSSGAIRINLRSEISGKIGESKEITAYRIIQEILNNTIKHAKASQVDIFIARKENGLKIQVKDNGIGLSPEKTKESAGIGWKNIYSRVAMMNGTIHVDSSPGKGVAVTIELPL